MDESRSLKEKEIHGIDAVNVKDLDYTEIARTCYDPPYSPPPFEAEKIPLGIDAKVLSEAITESVATVPRYEDIDWSDSGHARVHERETDKTRAFVINRQIRDTPSLALLGRQELARYDDKPNSPDSRFFLELSEAAIPANATHEEIDRLRSAGNFIGGMLLTKTQDTWQMHDRLVDPKYRGQHLGSQLIDGSEQYVQVQADKTNSTQELVLELGQLDVLVIFLKRGYQPVSAEDAKRIAEALTNPGRTLRLKTHYEEPSKFRRDYMIFPDSVSEQDEKLQSTLRIKIHKTFGPRDTEKTVSAIKTMFAG